MNASTIQRISENFNLSIILPYYKKYKEFVEVLQNNGSLFQRNGIEVILVLDEPTEEHLILELIETYPLINWVVMVNRQDHEWRNPAKAINVGIRASGKDFIMVCSPESQFHGDAVLELRYILEHYPRAFVLGTVVFCEFGGEAVSTANPALPYGSIMARKKHLEEVGGYSEYFDKWGGEDDQIRAKLEFFGYQKMLVSSALLIHYEYPTQNRKLREIKSREIPDNMRIRALRPSREDFISKGWGHDFSETIFHYMSKPNGHNACINYLAQFPHYEIANVDSFNKKMTFVVLSHVYNEEHYIVKFIGHLEEISDGIVLLDDGSSDNTFELSNSKKILCKVKKRRNGSNEQQNKNILLNIISFVNYEWCLFLDADEKLHLFGKSLGQLLKKLNLSTSYCFYLVHLWNEEMDVRIDVPEKSLLPELGLLHRWRMFKNIGRCQIIGKHKLHFRAIPFQDKKKLILPILIIHHGMIGKEKREKKFSSYLEIDGEEKEDNYRYFLDTNIKTIPLSTVIEKMQSQFK